jgi:hypothetical protein
MPKKKRLTLKAHYAQEKNIFSFFRKDKHESIMVLEHVRCFHLKIAMPNVKYVQKWKQSILVF